MREPIPVEQLTVIPANEASCHDLQAISATDYVGRCQCQHFKIRDSQGKSVSIDERARRLRDQTACGDRHASATSGLVAYLEDRPVGWVAVEPRTGATDDVRLDIETQVGAGSTSVKRPGRRPRLEPDRTRPAWKPRSGAARRNCRTPLPP